MRSKLARTLFVCGALFGLLLTRDDSVRAVSSTVVISEFRVRGPNGGNDEFIELYNASGSAVAIGGWKINGSNNAAGTSTRATITGGTTLQPGCFYLLTNSASGGYSGSVPGNQTYGTGVTDDGGIALLDASSVIIDQIGMSAGSAYKEGTILASLGSSNLNRGYERKPGGSSGNATDTDNNASDFQLITPSNPQNTSSSCIGGSTNPSGTMIANAATYDIGDPITLTVTVTPGTNPPSTAISVIGNLASINLGNPAFADQGNNVFAFTGTIPSGVSGGSKSLTASITDGQSRTATTSPATQVTINSPTPPTGAGSANPSPVAAGATTLLTVTVTPGTNPTSTGVTVTGDLSQIGIAGPQGFAPNGNTFTYSATVAASTPAGAKSLPITIADAQNRNATFDLLLTVTPPGAGKVIINEIDADTPGTDTAEFIELYDSGSGNTPLDGLVLVLYNGTNDATQQPTGNQSYVAFDLDGFKTDANGFFVLGNPGVPGAGIVFDPGMFGLLQNGPDAVALYIGDAGDFPPGAVVTTANLLDAIVYGTNDPNPSNLLTLINAGQLIVNEDANGQGTIESSQRCPNGMGGIRNSSAYLQAAPTPGAGNACAQPVPSPDVVISQVYGGGGNANATYHNDFVELFNRGSQSVDLGGWSIQYASSTGSGWDTNLQPLGGRIAPGEYYLIALAAGTASTGPQLPLPPANIVGQINMSGTSGKVALVDSFDPLAGNCPVGHAHVRDFVGYGSADCGEGATTAAALSNTTAAVRQGGGAIDTNVNRNDFAAAGPNPRRTAPIVEIGPFVLNTDPRRAEDTAPRDATIRVTFTEPVDVFDPWFDISCASTGQHNDATFAGGGKDRYITPNVNFQPGEQCTVTVFKDHVRDQDLDDVEPNTDTLRSNVVWTFTVATGAPPPYPSSVHLTMGNPSGATANVMAPGNYLMEKPEFALSYNRDLGRPNWVSWHLSDEWTGTLDREDTFRPDPAVPAAWYRVQSFDFAGSGFDRGHMTPNADRNEEASIPINQATFLMTNMLAQAPDNNQGPWAAFESYLRTLLPANELYIVAGGAGTGGTGSNGFAASLADGHVSVPADTWKVVLVLPKGDGNDISRVSCSTRTIAIRMPNIQGIRNDPWENYRMRVDQIETLTGYDLFSNVPAAFQRCIEAGFDGANEKLDPLFTALSPATIELGAASTTISGVLSLDGLGPTGSVAITFNGVTANAPIAANGQFSATFATGALGLGSQTVAFAYAGDDNFKPAAAASTITVQDTTGPSIDAVTASPNVLGAPNHKMIDVFVSYTATDLIGAPACSLSVASSETVNGTGDGNTSIDWVVIDAHHVRLRAERSGQNAGRVYTITTTCADASGNSSAKSVTVTVPK